jgi:uncharacterized tellurite resistance protein B-like protein
MMMEIPDEIFDRAFAIYEEFGPDRLIDRRERLEAELGIHSPETIDLIIERMKEISDTIWEIARQGGEIKLGEDKVIERIQDPHPYLKGEGLQKAIFLVNYFAWHEGFDV